MKNQEDENKSSYIKSGAKSLWKRIPLSVKLKIMGGITVVILLIVIIGVLASASPIKFLDFSDGVSKNNDIEENYEEFWGDFCGEDSEKCSDEQKKAAEEFKKSQEKFYDKLDKLVSKYNISKEQRYLVLLTIFYNYDIDDFTMGNDAYDIDGDDIIDENKFEKETDTLKELIKQFKVYSLICSFPNDPDNETARKPRSVLSPLNFGDRIKIKTGLGRFVPEYTEKNEECESSGGETSVEEATTSTESLNNYYKYLRENEFFDERENLSEFFYKYGTKNGLDPENISSWPEEDKQEVRQEIIDNIKEILAEYMAENKSYVATISRNYYLWPIGSVETTESNGVTLATGDPEFTTIISNFGMRIHPISGVNRLHDGVDLQGSMNETNVIAAMGGTVTRVVNECASSNSNGCGGGYGNHIEILDSKGNTTLYAHLYKDSITVSQNDTVMQGQVIGKVGSSGNSTGPHLHFTIRVNGSPVDPLDYVSPDNPRPAVGSDANFNSTAYTREEFIAVLEDYYTNLQCNGKGCTSMKNEILNGGAGDLYDIGTSHNINPELFVARSILEGYSPGVGYNYFGYAVYNGSATGTKFPSFAAGAEAFFDNADNYSSLEQMMSRYAYLGGFWYTGAHPGLGGCYYAPYIFPEGIPARVSAACSQPDDSCTQSNTANCVATTEDERYHYTLWQVQRMTSVMKSVFGG